ncbi:MAG: methyltransferase domain-containing protein [Thermomicrobiales bacterium]
MSERLDIGPAPSTGFVNTGSEWLDVHFEAMRPEYQRAVNLVPFQPSWHILDAGCGAGSFIPLLAERVGPDGRLTAIDLDPDSIETARNKFSTSPPAAPVEFQVANLNDLPFPDNHVDAVWLASVLMYVTEDELPAVIDELKRVVRPGGLIAAKEADGEMLRYLPMPMEYRTPFYSMDQVISGMYRARFLRYWFEGAGLNDVWSQTILVERWQPLRPVEREYIAGLMRGGVRLSEQLDMSDEARQWWQQQVDPDSPEAILNRPDFAYLAGHVVTVGRVTG